MCRILFCAALAAAVAACHSTPPITPEQARVNTLKELGLDPALVVSQDHVRYAIGSASARPTAFKSGLYVQTQTDLHLFRNKETGKALEQDVSFPLQKLRYATVEHFMFTDLKQLELGAPSGVIAVSFNDQADGMAGDAEKTDAAYAALTNAGVPAGKPAGRVWPAESVKPYHEVYPFSLETRGADHRVEGKPAGQVTSTGH